MTSPKLLVPLRVPELGPHLGKLVTGTGMRPGGLSLDDVRHRLATRLMESAGEARRLAAREERTAALATVGRATWLEAWEEVVAAVSDRIVRSVNQRLEAEGRAVRMGPRRRRRLVLGELERRALRARLGSAGARLVAGLDVLEQHAHAAQTATAMDRGAVEEWRQALKLSARRLEGAWLRLESTAAQELAGWERVADDVARWRRSLWPVFVAGLPLLVVAVWLGLVLGGYVPSPDWLTRAWQAVFAR